MVAWRRQFLFSRPPVAGSQAASAGLASAGTSDSTARLSAATALWSAPAELCKGEHAEPKNGEGGQFPFHFLSECKPLLLLGCGLVIEANVHGFTDDMNVHRLHNIGTRSIRRQIQRLIYRSGERITPTGSATANEKHCLRAFRPYPQNVATRIPQCGNRSTRGP